MGANRGKDQKLCRGKTAFSKVYYTSIRENGQQVLAK